MVGQTWEAPPTTKGISRGLKCINPMRGEGRIRLTLEEILVGAGAFQVDVLFGRGIDQDPIRFNVRVSVPGPIEFQRMVFILSGQRFAGEQ
jgi:hypothetical protein